MVAIVEQKRAELADLCRRFHVHRLELFGSGTQSRFNADRSDLDFLVVFESCGPAQYARRYFGLLAGLEDLFRRQIDLVDPAAIQNPYFRDSVERSRTSLYAA